MATMCSNDVTVCAYLILLYVLSSCSKVVMQQPFDVNSDSEALADYQIGTEDVLEIMVWENTDLSKIVTVRPDGRISLPLIGDVPAARFTTAQVKDEITERPREFYKHPPQVSTIVQTC